MTTTDRPFRNVRAARGAIVGLAIFDVVLVLLGLFLAPGTVGTFRQGWLAVMAAFIMLATYAALGWWGWRSTFAKNPEIPLLGSRFGLVLGILFVAEMLFEYLALPDSKGNERLAYLEFGGMFLLLFLAGLKGGRETSSVGKGMLTAIWTALSGSLIWVAGLLSTYYAFWGTVRQDQVLAADQVFEDFKRSGMTDLRAFIMQDYLGGVFFHLLIGMLVAAVLGAIGGMVARLITRP